MDSGTVELRSGRWDWRIQEPTSPDDPPAGGLRETAMADAEPEPDEDVAEAETRLVLEAPDDPRIRMARDVTPEHRPESDAEVRRLARDVDVRAVVDASGEVWRFESVERPDTARATDEFERPPRPVRFGRRDEPQRVGHLPPGRGLGDSTNEELLEVVRSEDGDPDSS